MTEQTTITELMESRKFASPESRFRLRAAYMNLRRFEMTNPDATFVNKELKTLAKIYSDAFIDCTISHRDRLFALAS